MFYTFYRIINNINKKIYYGIHRTANLNDGYMGSGTALKSAKQKYGVDNFSKEILNVFTTADEMFDKEAEMVTEEFTKSKTNYNIHVGGRSRIEDFAEQDYYKSGQHQINMEAARQIAIIRTQELKQSRITKYYNNPKICKLPTCNNPIPYKVKTTNYYCSSSCSATDSNTGRIVSDGQRNKARQAAIIRNNTISDNDLLHIIRNSKTIDEICNKIGIRKSARIYKRIRELNKKHNIIHLNYVSRNDEIETNNQRKKLILKSPIDFTKFGWVKQAAQILNMNNNCAGRWIEEHMPEFYKTCYKRKSIKIK